MIFIQGKVCLGTGALFILFLFYCALSAYRVNAKRQPDDSDKKDYPRSSLWLTPATPFILARALDHSSSLEHCIWHISRYLPLHTDHIPSPARKRSFSTRHPQSWKWRFEAQYQAFACIGITYKTDSILGVGKVLV